MSERIAIELDIPSWNIVAAAMGKLPIEVGMDVFLEIKRQMIQQESAKTATKVTPLHPVEEAG